MNLKNDFLTLIEILWDVERFDMWNPKEHGTLAYLLDRLSFSSLYQEKYNMLLELLKAGKVNEFAMKVSSEVVKQSKLDSNFNQNDIVNLENMLSWQEEEYNNNELSGFGIVKEKYMPNWFFELFHCYIKLKMLERENLIVDFCKTEKEGTYDEAKAIYNKLYTQYDILNEIYFFIKNKKFKEFYPVTAEMISAKQLCEELNMSVLDAYLYLVYLREEPEKALAEYHERLQNK